MRRLFASRAMLAGPIAVALSSTLSAQEPESLSVEEEYEECVREFANSRVPSWRTRYSDDLFAETLTACAKMVGGQEPKSHSEYAERSIIHYIATLKLINTLPRPKSASEGTLLLTQPNDSPPPKRKELGPMTRSELSVLIEPGARCVAQVAFEDPELTNREQLPEALKRAYASCDSSISLARAEIDRIMLQAGYAETDFPELKAPFIRILTAMIATGVLTEKGWTTDQ